MTQETLVNGQSGPVLGEIEPGHKRLESSSEDAPAAKRVKADEMEPLVGAKVPKERVKGFASIKEEYLIKVGEKEPKPSQVDDDAAEGQGSQQNDRGQGSKGKKRHKQSGQNIQRHFGRSIDKIQLCATVANSNEFSPKPCSFGERCNKCHDLRKYMNEGRRGDLEIWEGKCPVFEKAGRCPSGWRCRFVGSHSKEIKHDDGRMELVLIQDVDSTGPANSDNDNDDHQPGVVNQVPFQVKADLSRRKVELKNSDMMIQWMEQEAQAIKQLKKETENQEELRAAFVDPPLRPSEKRRIYFGKETPVLAPLTTQGNLPFRRLCVELGAQVTYSEMAMSLPMIQGQRNDWALLKAHESELIPVKFNPGSQYVVKDYDNSRDLKFGAQISGNQPWVVTKCTEALTRFCPHLRVVDLNCGCPIDMVYKAGAGSGLLDSPVKLERMVRGMNTVSGEVPITVKLRTGIREGKPTAEKIIEKLAFGSSDQRDRLGAPGCAAITLHGRSRAQRYTKVADWKYIAECAALINSYRRKKDDITDTAAEPDARTLPSGGEMYFLGNGDCYSHVDYYNALDQCQVDTVMIGRGAMIKPWLFEEIEKGQYLDKSASERLSYVEKFCRYGLEAWGSDELGIGFTRRFLLEWLSFTYRYIPVGILEHLPPSLNDRPPAYRGRNELETLLASDNYKDWIKISEMFLGPAHPDFKFQPKHKSNSYEIEAEG